RTASPASANTGAIPVPMIPAPTTAIRMAPPRLARRPEHRIRRDAAPGRRPEDGPGTPTGTGRGGRWRPAAWPRPGAPGGEGRAPPSAGAGTAQPVPAREHQEPGLARHPAELVERLAPGQFGSEGDLDVGQVLDHRTERLGQQLEVGAGLQPARRLEPFEEYQGALDEPPADLQPQG